MKLLRILLTLRFLLLLLLLLLGPHHHRSVKITQVAGARVEIIIDCRGTMISLTFMGVGTSSLAFMGLTCTVKGYKAMDGMGRTVLP